MTDVEEIIDYIKSLKKGFDKDLFQSKIDEIAYVVDSTGLDYDDFHTLFKVWLNLTIPITKWVSLGACLVPQHMVEERTVDYAFRWLLANYENHSNLSRMAFLLDWLTAAMDCASIDTVALDGGYEIFHIMLSFEVLTAHTIKLIYTLTKPSDVTRRRVLELLEYAQKREGKKNMYRQIQVLLGLYKSYRPECVPENVPAIAIHTCFKKINAPLMARFKKSQVFTSALKYLPLADATTDGWSTPGLRHTAHLYLNGDSGYPLRSTTMTPVTDPAPGTPEEYYQELHVAARNVIERCIGVLKARFRCLLVDRKLHYTPSIAAKIANACCVLHNIAHRANVPYTPLTRVEAARERELTEGASIAASQQLRGRRLLTELEIGRARRRALIQRLWADRALQV